MALVHAHPDIVYTIHNGEGASPFCGSYDSPDAIRNLAYTVLAEFDYLKYEPTIIHVDGDMVRAQVLFRYRHRATGNVIEGSRRLLFKVEDVLIKRLDSFEDARRLEAFIRMTRESAPSEVEPNLAALLIGRQTSGAGA